MTEGIRFQAGLRFQVGDKVIFRKSMRECEVVQVISNGNYIVARLSDSQLLYATPSGLLPLNDPSDSSESEVIE